MNQNFFIDRIKSFGFALCGLRDIVATEHNAKLHAFFTVMAIGLSLWLKIDRLELLFIIVVICLVWVTEAVNTVFELVIDIVSPQYTETAKRAKDMAAAAVLIASMGALSVGKFNVRVRSSENA